MVISDTFQSALDSSKILDAGFSTVIEPIIKVPMRQMCSNATIEHSLTLVLVLMLASLMLGCRKNSDKKSKISDGRVLITRDQTLNIQGLNISGKLPDNWKLYDRSQDSLTAEGPFVSFFSRAPGIESACAHLVLQPFRCTGANCGKKRIGKLREIKKNVWAGLSKFPPVVMGVNFRRMFIVVHRVVGSNSFLECRGTYECDDNEKMVTLLKEMCVNLKISKVGM